MSLGSVITTAESVAFRYRSGTQESPRRDEGSQSQDMLVRLPPYDEHQSLVECSAMQTLRFAPWCGTVATLIGLPECKRRAKTRCRPGAYPTSPNEFQSLLRVHSRPIVEQRAYNKDTIRQAQIRVASRWVCGETSHSISLTNFNRSKNKPSILLLARPQKRHETLSIQTREIVPQNGKGDQGRVRSDHVRSVEFRFVRVLRRN